MPAALTYELRHAVLRPHQSVGAVALPGDDDPETTTFAVLDDAGEVVSTANIRPGAAPFDVAAVAGPAAARSAGWRLRGMATRPDLRGQGLGAHALAAALGHVAARGGGLVWCNARLPALTFYERAGFQTEGESWVDPEIGPHIVMWRMIEATAAVPADDGG